MPKITFFDQSIHEHEVTLVSAQLDSLLHRAIAALERTKKSHKCSRSCKLCADLKYIISRRQNLAQNMSASD